MIVNTKAFGRTEIDERQILNFPYGIFGFENLTKYILLDSAQPPFYWLQSFDVREIAFVLINPFLFKPDYNPLIPIDDYNKINLSIEDTENILIFSIVTIPEKSEDMTANLQGPILINKNNKQGIQSISTNIIYRVKHRILEELSGVKDKVC